MWRALSLQSLYGRSTQSLFERLTSSLLHKCLYISLNLREQARLQSYFFLMAVQHQRARELLFRPQSRAVMSTSGLEKALRSSRPSGLAMARTADLIEKALVQRSTQRLTSARARAISRPFCDAVCRLCRQRMTGFVNNLGQRKIQSS